MTLEEQFQAAVLEASEEAAKLGAFVTRYRRMIFEHGAVEAARRLVITGDIQEGFAELAKLERLDLTMEAAMVRPEFRSLFRTKEIEAAEWRLANAKKAKAKR